MTSKFATREEILNLDDTNIKEVTVPDSIHAWGGWTFYIKTLTRGQQDAYLQRQFSSTKLRQDRKATQQEVSGATPYGHDAWLCIQGVCNQQGAPMFTLKDQDALNKKSGEAVGWLAQEILEFSGMSLDAKIAKGEGSSEEELLVEDIKN